MHGQTGSHTEMIARELAEALRRAATRRRQKLYHVDDEMMPGDCQSRCHHDEMKKNDGDGRGRRDQVRPAAAAAAAAASQLQAENS